MQITIKRFEFGTNYTIGRMYVDGQLLCFTLEDKVREVEGQPVEQWKVAGQTAIPKGTYDVTYDFSNRFQSKRPHILNVPGFDGIRIHTGNSDKDTEGCILLGELWAGGDWVSNSTRAYVKFEPLLCEALGRGDKVTITVE